VSLSDLLIEDVEKTRKKLDTPAGQSKLADIVREIISWPEFTPEFLNMHFSGAVNIDALHREVHREVA
jgi:hypothetical protein